MNGCRPDLDWPPGRGGRASSSVVGSDGSIGACQPNLGIWAAAADVLSAALHCGCVLGSGVGMRAAAWVNLDPRPRGSRVEAAAARPCSWAVAIF